VRGLFIGFLAAFLPVMAQVALAQKRSVSVSDCVCLRRIVEGPILSPDGRNLAYVLKSPDAESNRNKFEVRIRSSVGTKEPFNGRVVLKEFAEISGVKWLRDGMRLAALVGMNETLRGPSSIVIVDTRSGASDKVTIASGIIQYSMSMDGNTIAYSTSVALGPEEKPYSDPVLVSHGFHLPSDYAVKVGYGKGAVYPVRSEIWILRRISDRARWRKERMSPPSDALPNPDDRHALAQIRSISVSPDGRYLAFGYDLEAHLDAWESNRTVKAFRERLAVKPESLGVYDIDAQAFQVIPMIPFPHDPLWWSDDSHSVGTLSAAPISSRWAVEDAAKATDPTGRSSFHLFSVDLVTRTVSEVLNSDKANDGASIVSWKDDSGGMILNIANEDRLVRLRRSGDSWDEVSRSESKASISLNPSATMDGQHFVGVHQEAKVPPDIWSILDGKGTTPVRLTNLNPETADLAFGDVSNISWKNRFGASISGQLILPGGADKKSRYPLVIMLTWPDEQFVCDGHYANSFPPASLVDAGFAVVIFNVYNAFGKGSDRPSGPPLIQEAESTVASVEALVDYLSNEGVAMKDNVGIIGFSRSSWKVDYLITHSEMKLRAASSADGGVGNYGESWLNGEWWGGRQEDAGYGGSFLQAKSAWLAGAPAFNADRVKTPLLMEYSGASGLEDEPRLAYEFHGALVALNKPVELFFYPHGDHPLDTPFERIASLQRNLDWFRFWMLDREGEAPSYDPNQFLRWRLLKKQLTDNEAGGENGTAIKSTLEMGPDSY